MPPAKVIPATSLAVNELSLKEPKETMDIFKHSRNRAFEGNAQS